MALSPFQQAFADARSSGLDIFDFQGQRFTTQTAEEQQRKKGPSVAPLSPIGPIPQANSQEALQGSPVGQALSGPGQPSLGATILSDPLSLLMGTEEDLSGRFPQLGQVRQSFKDADLNAKALDPVERDVERHKTGSRNASLDVGFLTTLLTSQGHEFNTAQAVSNRVIQGDDFPNTSPTGQDLTPGRFAAESMQDSINNLFGQAEALLIQLGIGSRESPPDLGSVSIDRPGTRTEAFGSTVERGVNKLAELVGVLQEKLKEARSAPNAEPQIAAIQGSGGEPGLGQQP